MILKHPYERSNFHLQEKTSPFKYAQKNVGRIMFETFDRKVPLVTS